MKCPECANETPVFSVASDLLWCPRCRKVFPCAPDEAGKREAFFQLPEESGEVTPGSGVFYRREEDREEMSVTTFSFWGIVLALISAGWLFVTVFGFTIHPGIAAIFAVIAFFLVMGTISALHSRITIAYLPGTREIVYRKGPFRWWSRRRKFKAADVDFIEEGAVYTGLRDIPRPVVFFRDGRQELMLDLTANKVKRGHLWTWLIIGVERGNSE